MTKTVNIFVVAAAAATIAGAAVAQTTTFTNEDAAADQFDDLQEQIADDAERDVGRFGNEGRVVGTYGSVALRATAYNDDNGSADGTGDDNANVGLGLRYGTFDGVNGIDVTAAYNYSEDNGDEAQNQLLLGADYRRDFGPRYFGYAKLDASQDRAAENLDDNYVDVFLGAGLGYRILNDATSQWSIQAGPGYRYTETVGGFDNSEAAASISSNYYRSLSATSYVTNDTDLIYSDTSTLLTNDLALNVAMTNALSLRTSLSTSFDDSVDDTFGDASNTLGVAVVYNFN
jgi:putative salt-induced outer membrane protein